MVSLKPVIVHMTYSLKKVKVLTIATAVMNVTVNDDFRDSITKMNFIPQYFVQYVLVNLSLKCE